MPTTNPLLDFSALPRFDAIEAAHVTPAMTQLIEEAESTIERLATLDGAPTHANFVTPLDDATERVSRAWGAVGHLNAVVNSPALREAYNATLPVVTAFWTRLSQDERLFATYKAIAASSGFAALNAAQRRAIENEIRDFRLGGAELPTEQKARFAAIQEQLSTLSSRFNDNVLDATDAFSYVVEDAEHLAGLPDDALAAARAAAEAAGVRGWKFTLHMPSYLPVMQHAAYRPLRETLYRAYATRASALGADARWDNSAVMSSMLSLRAESAALLGFPHYAALSLAPKMADSAERVLEFLGDLARRAKPHAERDWRELVEFARDKLDMADVAAWDVAYVSERLRESRYAYSEDEVKQYFTEPNVLAGLFGVFEQLFGVKVVAEPAPTWHADARFHRVLDRDGAPIGAFYLDLYARENKRGGAWMDDGVVRRTKGGTTQQPVAYVTCNFSAPVVTKGAARPALFTHDDVITLFHEFGHALHHLLTEVGELGVSGINGVEWDAVELPSQFMENFCWEWDTVRAMSAHVDTGEALPRALFEKMLAAKNFQAGMQTVRQIEFGLLDMYLHVRPHVETPRDANGILAVLDAVRREVAVVPYPSYNRMPMSFGHIFGGGYAAGYYSYKWAEVLSADAYAAFEEPGVDRAAMGAKFRREILAVGGSRAANESFIAFRGRAPDIAALLRHNGMQDADVA
jgi:oligopeptidase A